MREPLTCPCCTAATIQSTQGRLLRWAWVWTPFCPRRSLILVWAVFLGLLAAMLVDHPLISALHWLFGAGALILAALLGAIYGTSEVATLAVCQTCRTGWVSCRNEPPPLPRVLLGSVSVVPHAERTVIRVGRQSVAESRAVRREQRLRPREEGSARSPRG